MFDKAEGVGYHKDMTNQTEALINDTMTVSSLRSEDVLDLRLAELSQALTRLGEAARHTSKVMRKSRLLTGKRYNRWVRHQLRQDKRKPLIQNGKAYRK